MADLSANLRAGRTPEGSVTYRHTVREPDMARSIGRLRERAQRGLTVPAAEGH
jgi:hypothetical protein